MGRLINCYAEARGENSGPVFHRAPGLIALGSDLSAGIWTSWTFPFEMWFNTRQQPSAGAGNIFRGGCVVANTFYAAFGQTVYAIDVTGSFTALGGTLPGSDKAFFARNNNATPDIAIVCEAGPYWTNGTANIQDYPDGKVGSPDCVCFHDGYFMFGYGTGEILASEVDVTTINALDFTTAETNPDGVTQTVSYAGQLYACGPATIEVYGLPVNSTAFPLTRVGYNITPGLIAPFCIAGSEAEFGYPPIWCASDNTVRVLDGSLPPDKISPPELDALIEAADPSDLEACCYTSKGHAIWQLSSSDWTWCFDNNTQKWHERQSYLSTRSRITGTVPAFNEWLAGDTESGMVLRIDPTFAGEVDDPLVVTIESSPVASFPSRQRVQRADFDFTVGQGIASGTFPIETDPSVRISWSDDGGVTWSNPWIRALGEQGQSQQRVTVINTGISGPIGRQWRLEVSDPIHFGLTGGAMDTVSQNK